MTRHSTETRTSIYDTVTAKIIRELEGGVLPWTKPWKSGVGKAGFSFPANATTGNNYSGINVLLLWLHGSEQGFPTQRWLTFPQALEAGGSVRKGEKGTQIVRAGTYTPKGEKSRAAEEGRDASVVPFLKAYTVFNVAQCDGLDEAVTGIISPDIDLTADLPRVEDADRTIAGTGIRFVNHPDKAFYHPADDVIAIPLISGGRRGKVCVSRNQGSVGSASGTIDSMARPLNLWLRAVDDRSLRAMRLGGSRSTCTVLPRWRDGFQRSRSKAGDPFKTERLARLMVRHTRDGGQTVAGGLSMTTVMISALVSIVTGYIGAMLSARGVRRQERRVYGLALLAEVKSIHRSLLRYQARIASFDAAGDPSRLKDARAALGFWRQDLSVYANNSSRIGLFRARTAVEIIEFYHRIRWLEARLAELDGEDGAEAGRLQVWIETQRVAIGLARHHARYLSRLLRHEVPLTADEMTRAVRRMQLRRGAVRPKSHFLHRAPTVRSDRAVP